MAGMRHPCPTEPTCSRTRRPDTPTVAATAATLSHGTAHGQTHSVTTPVPRRLARGSAYLQLQDQVHAVLAEGADVVQDERCDDVDAVGLVGHDAALGEQCNLLSHGCCQSSQLHPPTQHWPCLTTPGAPNFLSPRQGPHSHHDIINPHLQHRII